jgi:hypothetical protein
MNKQMDSKQAQRLLKSLESDPRLQAPDDATILSDEQYPVAFDAAILRLKDPISVTSTVTILGWNRDSRDQHLSAQDRDRLIKQQDTVRSTLLLTPTTDNPMDEISFQHWKHRITNICLDAAQVALQTVDDNTSLKYLFQPSATSTSTVRRADTRNIQGLVLYHPIILDSPWTGPPNIENKILELIRERDPLLLARAYPDLSQVWDNYEYDRLYEASMVAMRTITTLQESIKVLLQRIYKFTSHTFHVLLREIIPEAKAGKSHLFTMIVEHRNQFLTNARETKSNEPYTALHTLEFIKTKFVRANENTTHIAWTVILLHTRTIGQPIYQWQASFDPLLRKYEQARGKKMKDKSMLKVKVLMAKQFTDDEKIILAGIDTGYSISDIDNGKFKLKKLQSDLAEHVSRFTRRYNPDARIIAYLRKRAEEFRTEVPSFLNKRKTDASAVQEPVKKRARPQGQRRLYPGFMMCANPVCISNHVAHTHDTAQCHYYNAKGKGTKGKDKGYNPRFDGKGKPHDGKGKGLKGKKGKIQSPKGAKGGKGVKGKSALGSRIQESSAGDTNITESVKSMVCDFCHKPNHVRQNCRKLQALNNSKTYRQARNRHDKRRQFLFTMMENSVFSPNTCSWCLGVTCDGGNCYPPDDPVFFTETNNIFCEEILPLVKNAKLELPLDSADPLIPYQFHFEDTGWGQQWGSNFDYEEYQRDHSSELWEKEMASSLWYDNAPGWGHPYHDQDWYWQAQATSTWQDENLLDGSAANEEVESISKDVLLEENSASNSIGLQIEEDDVQEQLDEDASGGSSEEV